MARRPASKGQSDKPTDHTGVIIGWTHHDLGTSIDLRIQSAASQQALNENRIDSHHFLMTHNQALMLAKYLLDTTGQTLPVRQKPALWRRLWNRDRK